MQPGDIGWLPRVTEASADRDPYREGSAEERPRRKRPKPDAPNASSEAPASPVGPIGQHIDLKA
uniref:Uncharacterized protein n=1 Tax=Rhodothermus marinus TaxID=29549 RepID=A0A7V2F756_RHOMR